MGDSLTNYNPNLQKRISTLEKRVIKYRKLDRIDFALLSVSSIFGLFFGAVNYIIGNPPLALSILIPTFVIAWAIPFYINLSTDVSSIRLIEHVRAWVYFFVGLLFYFVATFVVFASSRGFLKDWLVLYIIIFPVSIIWSKIPQINKKLIKIIFGWYGEKTTKKAEENIYSTLNTAFIGTAVFVGSTLFLYVGYLTLQLFLVIPDIKILLALLYFSILGPVLFVYGLKTLVSFERSIKHK